MALGNYMRLACLVRGERRHVNDRSEMAGRADTLCNEHHLLGERDPPHIRWILPSIFGSLTSGRGSRTPVKHLF
ncbi:hypothetical protein D5086_017340 [Populus alba]|uniref:Uncharacterized protein n=1 Tax=Populus alba TaxID=43335 RepID=A0ACC4BZ76_POPAL